MTTFARDKSGRCPEPRSPCLSAVSGMAMVVVFEMPDEAVGFSELLSLVHEFGRVVHLQGVHCYEGRAKLLVEFDWASSDDRAAALRRIAEWAAAHAAAWRAYSLDHGGESGDSLRAVVREGVASLSDDDVRALSAFLASLARARASGDTDGAAYFADAVASAIVPVEASPDVDLTEHAARLEGSEPGRTIATAIAESERTFFERYQAFKSKSGLNTYRKLAEAAGLSVSTVQAIEDQRIKPQFRTIEKLARAFGVPVETLLTQ